MTGNRTVFIYGCFHEAQPVQGPSYHAARRDQHRSEVSHLIEQHGIRFVAEEWARADTPTIARQLCDERSIEHALIDIPKAVQNQIHHCMAASVPNENGECVETVRTCPYAHAWALVREWHMKEEFLRRWTCPESALLICGAAHAERFENLLRDRFTVRCLYASGIAKPDPVDSKVILGRVTACAE